MTKKKKVALCAVLAVAVLAVITVKICKDDAKEEIYISGSIASKTEEELIMDSDLIVKGQVKESLKSKWSNPDALRGEGVRNILQTDIIINVDEVIDGSIDKKTVAVRINKGEDEKTIVYSDNYPDFDIGENVLLFLARDDSDVKTNEDYYVLTGMRQGKYSLKPSSGTYVNDRGEIEISALKERIIKEKR